MLFYDGENEDDDDGDGGENMEDILRDIRP